jgi:hypothetical protein
MFVLSVVLSVRGLCDELITHPGVLPTVVCSCVRSRNLRNEEAKTRIRSQRHSKKIIQFIFFFLP